MKRVLLDTGPLVAVLDAGEPEHRRCVEALSSLRPPLLTTWAVVTEAMHLLDHSSRAADAVLELIERETVEVAALGVEDVGPIRKLLEKYADVPMDFADATLVRLGEREGTHTILTLDRRGFLTYRLPRRRKFEVLPG